MKIKPYRDIVLIKAVKPKDRTDSGLYLSETWKTLPLEGTVISVGENVKQVKPGDSVLFMRYASVILDNDERLVKERHIFAGLHNE